jgi:hypothetical protein
MKKVFIILLFISSFSYGQNLEMRLLLGPSLDMNVEFKTKEYGGIGLDVYNTHVINNVEKSGYGVYLVSPSIKNFDLICGVGWVSDWLPVDKYETVNGYYRSNGTWVNSYKRYSKTVLEPTNTKTYGIIGVSKTFYFMKDFGVTIRQVNRVFNFRFSPDLQIGLSFIF